MSIDARTTGGRSDRSSSSNQPFRRAAVFRGFEPPPPALRATTAFRAVFVAARFAAGLAVFAVFAAFPLAGFATVAVLLAAAGFAAFALPAAFVAVLD